MIYLHVQILHSCKVHCRQYWHGYSCHDHNVGLLSYPSALQAISYPHYPCVTGRAGASTLWMTLRNDSRMKLLDQDASIPAELKVRTEGFKVKHFKIWTWLLAVLQCFRMKNIMKYNLGGPILTVKLLMCIWGEERGGGNALLTEQLMCRILTPKAAL